MAGSANRATIYDSDWQAIAHVTVEQPEPRRAAVQSGSLEALEPGRLYRIQIFGRYYACVRDESDPAGLRLNDLAYASPDATAS